MVCHLLPFTRVGQNRPVFTNLKFSKMFSSVREAIMHQTFFLQTHSCLHLILALIQEWGGISGFPPNRKMWILPWTGNSYPPIARMSKIHNRKSNAPGRNSQKTWIWNIGLAHKPKSKWPKSCGQIHNQN